MRLINKIKWFKTTELEVLDYLLPKIKERLVQTAFKENDASLDIIVKRLEDIFCEGISLLPNMKIQVKIGYYSGNDRILMNFTFSEKEWNEMPDYDWNPCYM